MSNRLSYALIAALLLFVVGCQTSATEPEPVESETETNQLATSVTVEATEEPVAQWQVVNRFRQEFNPSFVAFANAEFGISSCKDSPQPPSHYITADGGQSWESSECIFRTSSIDIVDNQSMWICGNGNLKTSQDAGQSWEQLGAPLSEGCNLISFADNEAGWAAASSNMVATNDGGVSWEAVGLPDGIQSLAALSLRTPDNGYILDTDLTFYSTDDGGNSWSAQTLEIEDADLALASMGIASAAVRFSDNDNGIVVVNLAGGGKSDLVALHSADGGQTWTQHDVPTELGSVYLSHDNAYLTVTEPGKGIVILENRGLAARP